MKFRLILLSTAALMASSPLLAQTATIEGRVGKLEKEMRAVQREVFPGGAGKFFEPEIKPNDAPPTPSQPSTTAVSDLITRVDAIEAQLATITGQVEQQGNNLRSMETRLAALEAQLKAQTAPVETPNAAAAPVTVTPRPATPAASNTVKPPPATPTAARTAAVAAIERPASGDDFDDGYNYGYRLWEAKFYPEAQTTLQETVARNPKHRRISYARNLLGRAWLDDKKPATAVKIFYDNYKNDPKGERAPDSLLYLSTALTDLGKNAEACEALGELTRTYADAAAGRLAERVASGRTRAKCK